jgi:hypothetical protein
LLQLWHPFSKKTRLLLVENHTNNPKMWVLDVFCVIEQALSVGRAWGLYACIKTHLHACSLSPIPFNMRVMHSHIPPISTWHRDFFLVFFPHLCLLSLSMRNLTLDGFNLLVQLIPGLELIFASTLLCTWTPLFIWNEMLCAGLYLKVLFLSHLVVTLCAGSPYLCLDAVITLFELWQSTAGCPFW